MATPRKPWRCVCDGRYAGCTHGRTCPAGPDAARGKWSPKYWCELCDQHRMDHITANLEAIKVQFSDRG